jgi:hypothetical protein
MSMTVWLLILHTNGWLATSWALLYFECGFDGWLLTVVQTLAGSIERRATILLSANRDADWQQHRHFCHVSWQQNAHSSWHLASTAECWQWCRHLLAVNADRRPSWLILAIRDADWQQYRQIISVSSQVFYRGLVGWLVHDFKLSRLLSWVWWYFKCAEAVYQNYMHCQQGKTSTPTGVALLFTSKEAIWCMIHRWLQYRASKSYSCTSSWFLLSAHF